MGNCAFTAATRIQSSGHPRITKTFLDTEPPLSSTPAKASRRHIIGALESISAIEEHPNKLRTNCTDKSKGPRAEGQINAKKFMEATKEHRTGWAWKSSNERPI